MHTFYFGSCFLNIFITTINIFIYITVQSQSTLIFSSPGTISWTVPPCVTEITVQAWGGGGGGGAAWSKFNGTCSQPDCATAEVCCAGGGGGGGGFAQRTYTVVPGQVYTITVGAGGLGGIINTALNTNRAQAGLQGGNSIFSGPATSGIGSLTAFGGNGGGGANYVNTSFNNSMFGHNGANGTGGNGGTGAAGSIIFNGGNGSSGAHSGNNPDVSGAGGGCAGSNANGANGTSPGGGAQRIGGTGGAANGGNGANGNRITSFFGYTGQAGITGFILGGGGSGALIHNRIQQGGSSQTAHRQVEGGNGERGEVRITYIIPNAPKPVFNTIAPICSGETLNPLPITSINGISGTWQPTLNNTATTTYFFTPNANTCADTASITIIVNPTVIPTFNQILPICSGDVLNPLPSTSINGVLGTWQPPLNNTTTTSYIFTPNNNQCATIANMTIIVNPIVTPIFNEIDSICSGEILNPLPTTSNNGINGTWQPALNNLTTTNYTFTPNIGQCAISANTTIRVIPSITPFFNQIAPICSSETLSPLPTTSTNGINGTWLPTLNNTATTNYIFTPSIGQCATQTSLQVEVKPVAQYTDVVTACDSFTWINGVTYYESTNTANLILNNAAFNGCDSVIDLNLSITNSKRNFIHQQICEGSTFVFNNQNITSSGIYTANYNTVNGCDSTVTLNLIVNNIYNDTVTISRCTGQSYFAGGALQNTSGIYSDSYTSSSGCDSIIITLLSFNSFISYFDTVSICNGESYFAGGTLQQTSGNYIDTFISVGGCDSLVFTNLTVISPTVTSINAIICENQNYLFAGMQLNAAGVYSDTLQSILGCDSIVLLNLQVNSSVSTVIFDTICQGEKLIFDSIEISESGLYTLLSTSETGCDSTTLLNIFVINNELSITPQRAVVDTGATLQISVTTNAVSPTYLWVPDTYLSCNNCPNPTITPYENTNYQLTVADKYGCEATALLQIIVNKDCKKSIVYIPNAFSPNGDGNNDFFEVFATAVNFYNLKIFNRWGEKIFEASSPFEKWDGTYKGIMQLPGVYVYFLKTTTCNGEQKNYKGSVTIIK